MVTELTTDELSNAKVLRKAKYFATVGKVRSFVFHPHERRCIGVIVKRPDLLWMFHRKDLFVTLDGFSLKDGRLKLNGKPDTTNGAACRRLDVDWDSCTLWIGMPVVTESGESLGLVRGATFDRKTGEISSIAVSTGITNDALLGKRVIPGSMIKGFKRGIGTEMASSADPRSREGKAQELATSSDVQRMKESGAESATILGGILVSDAAKKATTEGGLAETAGKATAVAADRAKQTAEAVKEAGSEAVVATGKVINKGVYATGKQIAKSKTMFSDFKDEYDKARGPKTKKSSEKSSSSTAKSTKSTSAKSSSGTTKSGTAKSGTKSTTKTASTKTASSTASTKSTTKTSTAKSGSSTKSSGTKSTAKKSSSKGMFAAFKEEYDKASK